MPRRKTSIEQALEAIDDTPLPPKATNGKSGGKIVSSEKRVAIEARRDKVMALARAGATVRQIGAHLGVSHDLAAKDIKARLKENAAMCEDAKMMRMQEVDRLDALLTVWWNTALKDLGALDRVLRIVEQRARYLGVAPPTTTRHQLAGQIDVGGGDREIKVAINYVATTNYPLNGDSSTS